MNRLAALLGTVTAIALGCGGTVITPSQSSDATSGNGGATATATATAASTGGIGGAGGSVFTSSGTGSPTACNDPTVFVDIVGDGVNQHYDASCAPEAHLLLPGGAKTPPPPPGATLTITTCTLGPSVVLALSGQSSDWPASVTVSSIIYYHDGAEYDASPDASSTLDVVTFEQVGGVVEGAFTLHLAPKDPAGAPAKIQIAGKFRVCHGPDWVPV